MKRRVLMFLAAALAALPAAAQTYPGKPVRLVEVAWRIWTAG
jgi:hypothetical protein